MLIRFEEKPDSERKTKLFADVENSERADDDAKSSDDERRLNVTNFDDETTTRRRLFDEIVERARSNAKFRFDECDETFGRDVFSTTTISSIQSIRFSSFETIAVPNSRRIVENDDFGRRMRFSNDSTRTRTRNEVSLELRF